MINQESLFRKLSRARSASSARKPESVASVSASCVHLSRFRLPVLCALCGGQCEGSLATGTPASRCSPISFRLVSGFVQGFAIDPTR